MIAQFYLDEWRQLKAPWLRLNQIEQDLIISRALVEMYNHPKIKIEINTTEHYHVLDHLEVPYKVESAWFKGETKITSYQLNELMGTKLRALYQRRKGRDLFDIWLMLDKKLIEPNKVSEIFLEYCKREKLHMTRAIFEKNLFEKAMSYDFKTEIRTLITTDTKWDFAKAYKVVLSEIIANLPGEKWKHKKI